MMAELPHRLSITKMKTKMKKYSAGRELSCFVISPIGDHASTTRDHADSVFDKLIVSALDRLKDTLRFARPIRSDQYKKSGKISNQIFDLIADSDLCIAVLTDQNANVCYELGIAHTLRIPVINLIDQKQRLPSDIADIRTVMYDITRPEASVQELIDHINSLKQTEWEAPQIIAAAISPPRPQYDVFISVPMTSVTAEEYPELRKNILLLARELKKKSGFERVYTAVERIKTIESVEPSAISVRKDLDALEKSKFFVMVYPSAVRSSALIEAGYALAQHKPSVYLYRNEADLPFMLRRVGEQRSVNLLQYVSENTLQHQAGHVHSFLSSKMRSRA